MNRKHTLPKRLNSNKQTEILELKYSIDVMKNALESIGNRAHTMEERIASSKIEI